MPVNSSNLDYLIDSLRLHLGDISSPYRYADEWLRTSLVISVKALQRWWNYKYLIDDDDNVDRNDNYSDYLFSEPPIVERGDEKPIVLMASIIIKEGSLEDNSWAVGSWRDAEIGYSNIEGNRSKMGSIQRDWEELTNMLKPPVKRLAQPRKGSLPGYKNNIYERETKY